MRLAALLLWLLALAVPSLADDRLAFWQSRGSGYNQSVGATYSGPGDIVASAAAWYGLRAYNAAYATPGTNKSVNLRRASDNATCDFVISATGALGGTAGACAQGGGLSLAGFATTDATGTGAITGTTLTFTGGHVGDTVTGGTTANPTYIVSGASPTWTVNTSQTVASATLTLTYGLYVAEVYDQSGNTHHATQATSASQPQLLPTCISGLPCVSNLSASSQTLSSTIPTQAQPFTLYTVVDRIGSTSAFNEVISSDSAGTSIGMPNSANTVYMAAGTVRSVAGNDNSWHVIQGIFNGASSTFNVDNSATSPGTPGVNNISTALVLNAGNSGGNALQGYDVEWGYWASTFSSGNQTSICHNAFVYWGTGTSC